MPDPKPNRTCGSHDGRSTQKLFSIVIPAYNYGHLISRALESVLSQSGDDYDVLVVDDGSSDDTAQVVQTFVDKYPAMLSYIYQNNRGSSGARNTGIAHSHGRYLVFLDADDELVTDALASARAVLCTHPEVGMLIGGYYSVHPGKAEKYRPVPPLPASREQCFLYYLKKKITLATGALFMNRDLFKRLSYNEALVKNEDIPVFGHVLANFDCRSLNQPIVKIHHHQQSKRNNVVLAKQAGFKVVDELFNPDLLPPSLMKYRRAFFANHCLSLFRQYYRAGDDQVAIDYFRQAIKSDPVQALKFGSIRKYLRILMRRLLARAKR